MSAAKEAKQLVEVLRKRNPELKVEKGRNGHWLVTNGGGGLVGTVPGTPSDVRSIRNCVAFFKSRGYNVDGGEPHERNRQAPFGSLPGDAVQVELAREVAAVLAEMKWPKTRFGALVRSEARRVGLTVPSTDESAAMTVGNLLREDRRVTESFMEATRAALRVVRGPVVQEPERTPLELVRGQEPAEAPEPEVPEVEKPRRKVRRPWAESLAVQVLARMAQGAQTDGQLAEAVALAAQVEELEAR